MPASPASRQSPLLLGLCRPTALLFALGFVFERLLSDDVNDLVNGSLLVLAAGLWIVPNVERRRGTTVATSFAAVVVSLIMGMHVVMSGGLGAAALHTVPLLPLVVVWGAGWRLGLAWTIATVLFIVTLGVLDGVGVAFPMVSPPEVERALSALAAGLATVTGFAFAWHFEHSRARTAAERLASLELAQRSERLASLGTMSMGICHELNNPLSYTLGNLEVLEADLRRGTPPSREEMIEMLADSIVGARRMRDIVARMREFGAAERSGEKADLSHVLALARDLAAHALHARASVSLELPEARPWVSGNAGELTQVFVSLLTNAAESLREGHAPENHVAVKVSVNDGEVEVRVSDTGEGMSAETRARVFDPFFTTKLASRGLGLGLSIVQRILTATGGAIRAEANLPQGSTFVVTLRRRSAVPSGDVVVVAAAPASAGPAVPVPVPLPAPRAAPVPVAASATGSRRVLVVDDDPTVCRLLTALMRDHRVTAVGSGREAADLLQRDQDFDVIMSDLSMPDVSGSELYELCRARQPALAERFVFITGGATTEESARFLERTTQKVLQKPVTQAQLLDSIRAIPRRAA